MGPWRRLWQVGGLDVCSGQQRWALVCCVPLCCPVGRGGEGRSDTEGQGLPATEPCQAPAPADYPTPWPCATFPYTFLAWVLFSAGLCYGNSSPRTVPLSIPCCRRVQPAPPTGHLYPERRSYACSFRARRAGTSVPVPRPQGAEPGWAPEEGGGRGRARRPGEAPVSPATCPDGPGLPSCSQVIAVVMDMFTDVDIFKDLLDASFKRKVAVYIIVDESSVKHFLHMCARAHMHLGHLKNLRVRSSGGTEFFTRSATKFKGALAQKFMFVDGDRAICGSYSFTWSAARTDRNVISVLSGQVVEMFDRQFQELYLTSHGVSLDGIPMEKEPEPEPIVLHSVVPQVPSGTMAKKLVNPKYALVKAKSADEIARLSSEKQEAARTLGVRDTALAELPGGLPEPSLPIHQGLLNLERANMFEYLPTWVEPDPEPGSDILGYINIIDPKIWNPQPNQMNRIKIRDTSQAGTQLWRQSQDSSPAPQPRSPQDGVPAENSLPQWDAEPCPPVPKPRTVPVADLLAQEGGGVGWALETPEGRAPHNRTDHGLPRTAGPGHAPLQRQLSVTQDDPESGGPVVPNGLEGEEEEDDDDYVTLSDQESLSGSSGRGPGPQRPSVAPSSMSDECSEVTERSATLRRCHSEQVANGPAQPPCRQLSAPHMTCGTFGGPLGGSSWAQGQEREEAGTLRRMQAPHLADKEAQGQRFHHYGVPRDKDGFPQPSRTLGPPRYRPAADGAQISSRKAGPAVAGPQHRQAKGGPRPCALPGPGTPKLARNASPQADGRATEEHPSPLGIPYSKLSQSKHLKARMGGGQWASSDPKRQPQAPRDCKDP
eukprot:bmy_17033T0